MSYVLKVVQVASNGDLISSSWSTKARKEYVARRTVYEVDKVVHALDFGHINTKLMHGSLAAFTCEEAALLYLANACYGATNRLRVYAAIAEKEPLQEVSYLYNGHYAVMSRDCQVTSPGTVMCSSIMLLHEVPVNWKRVKQMRREFFRFVRKAIKDHMPFDMVASEYLSWKLSEVQNLYASTAALCQPATTL